MNKSEKSIVFVSAHPDDDSLIAGTIKKIVDDGWTVHEFVCTTGKNGKPNAGEVDEVGMVRERGSETTRFMEMVGGQPPHFFDNATKFLVLTEDVVLDLVRFLRKVRPLVLVLLNHNDYHFEHRISHEIGLRAIEIAMRSSVLEFGPKVTDCVILQTDGLNLLANPTLYVDVSEVWSTAREACATAYAERLGDLLHMLDGLHGARGGRIGVASAEAYELLNPEWYKLTARSAEVLAEFMAVAQRT